MQDSLVSRVYHLSQMLLLLHCSKVVATAIHHPSCPAESMEHKLQRLILPTNCRLRARSIEAASAAFLDMRTPAFRNSGASAGAFSCSRLFRTMAEQQPPKQQRNQPSLATGFSIATVMTCLRWHGLHSMLRSNTSSKASCGNWRGSKATSTRYLYGAPVFGGAAQNRRNTEDVAAATLAANAPVAANATGEAVSALVAAPGKAAAAAAHTLLCSKINELNKAYYSGGEPLASDEEFDALWLRLGELEKKYPGLGGPSSPLQCIGHGNLGAATAPANLQHLSPVLSLESVHSPGEANALFDRLDRFVGKALHGVLRTSVGRSRRRKYILKATTETNTADILYESVAAAPATAAAAEPTTAVPAATDAAAEGDVFAEALLMEPKVDGQSVSLTYELSSSNTNSGDNTGRGILRYRLVRALTRGDGRRGESITQKALQMAHTGSLPLVIDVPYAKETRTATSAPTTAVAAAPSAAQGVFGVPRTLEVRGEAYMCLSALSALNKRRMMEGLKPFSTPRHAVVGMLRRLEEEANCAIRFCAYALVGASDGALSGYPDDHQETHRGSISAVAAAASAAGNAVAGVTTQLELLQRLQQWGFEVLLPHCLLVVGRKDALEAFSKQSRSHEIYMSNLGALHAAIAGALHADGASRHPGCNADSAPLGGGAINPASVGGGVTNSALFGDGTSDVSDAACERSAGASSTRAAGASLAAKCSFRLEDIPCDGVVFKVNSLPLHQRLGSTARAPRWAFALKFAATVSKTKVLGIEWTVGSSGVCTPVALLQPVLLGGVLVGRASLHSPQEVRRKDVRVGDRVHLQLKGESVPHIVAVDLENRQEGTEPVPLPSACPSCGRGLIERSSPTGKLPKRCKQRLEAKDRSDRRGEVCSAPKVSVATPAASTVRTFVGEEAVKGEGEGGRGGKAFGVLWCPGGWACASQRLLRLRRFFSREGVAVAGLGPRALEALISRGYLEAPSDAFHLPQVDRQRTAAGESGIAGWPGWGPQARDALFKEIEQVQGRGVPLQQLLFALGIPGMGRRAAAAVSHHVRTIGGFLALLDNLNACCPIDRILQNDQTPQETPKVVASPQTSQDSQHPLGCKTMLHTPQNIQISQGFEDLQMLEDPQVSRDLDGHESPATLQGLHSPTGDRSEQSLDWTRALPGIELSLVKELRMFAKDKRNRQQLIEVTKVLPVHPETTAG